MKIQDYTVTSRKSRFDKDRIDYWMSFKTEENVNKMDLFFDIDSVAYCIIDVTKKGNVRHCRMLHCFVVDEPKKELDELFTMPWLYKLTFLKKLDGDLVINESKYNKP